MQQEKTQEKKARISPQGRKMGERMKRRGGGRGGEDIYVALAAQVNKIFFPAAPEPALNPD